MENKKPNINKKRVIVWVVVVLTVFGILLFSIWLCFEKIKSGSEKLFLERTRIAGLENQVIEIENFKKDYNNYSSNLRKIDQLFIDPQNPLSFIEFLENSALSANVELQISPLIFSKEESYKTVSLQLTTKGNFFEVIKFLEILEKGPFLLSVENLSMGSSGSLKLDSKNPLIQGNFSIKALTK